MADYVLLGPKWDHRVITYSIATQNFGGEFYRFDSFFDAEVVRQPIMDAFAAWSAVANVAFLRVEDAPEVNIRFGRHDIDSFGGSAAWAAYWATPDNKMDHVLIQWDTADEYLEGSAYFGAILKHEIGHALGLGHIEDVPALMNPLVGSDEVPVASDIEGIQVLYGPPVPEGVVILLGPGEDFVGTAGNDWITA